MCSLYSTNYWWDNCISGASGVGVGGREGGRITLTKHIFEWWIHTRAALAEEESNHIVIRQTVLPGEDTIEERVNGSADDRQP